LAPACQAEAHTLRPAQRTRHRAAICAAQLNRPNGGA